MNGQVNARREAEVPLRVYGPSGTFEDVACVVDTGFTGKLTLPNHIISRLVLDQLVGNELALADGTVLEVERYDAEVDWFGQRRPITVSAIGLTPLIGMALLDGHELRIEATVGGVVEIQPLVP